MIETATDELETLARDAAREIAGPGACERVEVAPIIDLQDRPADHFTFLINPDRFIGNPGMAMIDLALRLGDELAARGDDHRPVTRFLGKSDWENRGNAGQY